MGSGRGQNRRMQSQSSGASNNKPAYTSLKPGLDLSDDKSHLRIDPTVLSCDYLKRFNTVVLLSKTEPCVLFRSDCPTTYDIRFVRKNGEWILGWDAFGWEGTSMGDLAALDGLSAGAVLPKEIAPKSQASACEAALQHLTETSISRPSNGMTVLGVPRI